MFDTLKEAKAWVREHSVVVKARQRKPYTYIEVHAYEIDLRVERDAWAVAKCNPRDEWSDKIGIDKARGEAEAIIARRLVRDPRPNTGVIGAFQDMGKAIRGVMFGDSPDEYEAALRAIVEHVSNPNADEDAEATGVNAEDASEWDLPKGAPGDGLGWDENGEPAWIPKACADEYEAAIQAAMQGDA